MSDAPNAAPSETNLPVPAAPDDNWRVTEGAAYRVADMVRQGSSATTIADILYGHHEAKHLVRVHSLMLYAFKQKLLIFNPPINEDLQDKLAGRFDHQIKFHVVNNDHIAHLEDPATEEVFRADVVCRQAAKLVAKRIESLLLDKSKENIVVATAGGLAVSRIVRLLDEEKLIPDEAVTRRLLFISLNSASMPTDYGYSANTLAVRMAQIYGGRHIALCPVWPDKVRKDYEKAVLNIDLLVCGAGSQHGMLFNWLKDHAKISLPSAAVGDIALIPISADGKPVPLARSVASRVAKILNPHPAYEELQTLASKDRIVYVAVGHQADDRRPLDPAAHAPTHSKLAVTLAILRRSLARTCVLGNTLARDLGDATKPPTPPAPNG